jgi:hypothetical protein
LNLKFEFNWGSWRVCEKLLLVSQAVNTRKLLFINDNPNNYQKHAADTQAIDEKT